MCPVQHIVIFHAFIPRYQMYMKMKYGLSGNFAIILQNVKTVTCKHPCHMHSQLLCKHGGLCQQVIPDFIKIGSMLFWKNQRMAPGSRIRIQNHLKILIFINRPGRNLPCNNFAENTVFISHFHSPLFFLLFMTNACECFCVIFYIV